MSWWVKSCAHHEFTIGMLGWWVKSLLLLCFVWHRPKDIAHGGCANTSRHTIQAQASRQQADIQTHESTNKQTASRHTNTWKHMGGANASSHTIQAQASRQETHESTNKQTASRHTRHKKTTPDTWMHRDKTDTQDTRHKTQAQSWVTHESTNKQAASRHTRHKKNHYRYKNA